MQFLVQSLCPLPLLVYTTENTLAHFSSPMRCLYALIRSPLLYNPSSFTLCSHKTNAPRCSSSSMPTPLILGSPACQVCTHPAQGAVGLLCFEVTAGSWSMHPPGPPGLFLKLFSRHSALSLQRCMGLVSASLLPWPAGLGCSSLGLAFHSVDTTDLFCKAISNFVYLM